MMQFNQVMIMELIIAKMEAMFLLRTGESLDIKIV